MYAPSSPESSLRLQHVIVGTLWFGIVAFIAMAVVVFRMQPKLGWAPTMGLLGLIGVFLLLFAAMLPAVQAGAENFRRHISTSGTHHCQCRDCGRTFRPDPNSPPGRAHPIFIPQQRWAMAQAIVKISPYAGATVLLAFIAGVVFEALMWVDKNGSMTQFFTSDALISVLFALLLTVVSGSSVIFMGFSARYQRNRSAREIAIHSPQHGCTCAWCGRKNMPLFPTVENANPMF